jgi:hypothetical protein
MAFQMSGGAAGVQWLRRGGCRGGTGPACGDGFAINTAQVVACLSLVLCVAALALTPFADRALPGAVTPNKQRPEVPPIATVWNTFSRIDVYNMPGTCLLVIDAGTALTSMLDLRPGVRQNLSRNTTDELYESGAAMSAKSDRTS